MSECESEPDEISLKQQQLEGLINDANEGLTKATAMIINFSVPEPESERSRLWAEADLKPQITVFELRDLFERLKPFACCRPKDQSWFAFMRWLLWDSLG